MERLNTLTEQSDHLSTETIMSIIMGIIGKIIYVRLLVYNIPTQTQQLLNSPKNEYSAQLL